MAQRDTAHTLSWYANHQTASEIGFDPDGMCMKVCRSARNLPAKYPSALAAQVATPPGKRVGMAKLKPGMVAFYDDPNDSNPYGHIVTVHSVAPIVRSLADIVVWTNSVETNTLVKVRGDYFPTHWGDKFQFGATWLNGYDLLMTPDPAPAYKGPIEPRLDRLRHARADLHRLRDDYRTTGNTRIVEAITRDIAELSETINRFGSK